MDALIPLVISLAVLGFWIFTLVDAIRRPGDAYSVAGQNKILWVLLIVFLGIIGSVLYMIIPRPKLERV